MRLVADQTDDPHTGAVRFLESAGQMGIDLSLMWASVPSGASDSPAVIPEVRHVCLLVRGAGRTAMLFVSGPSRGSRRGGRGGRGEPEAPGSRQAAIERAAVIQAACEIAAKPEPGNARTPSRLAQALLEPRERDALVGFLAAGFTQVGDLAYMRRQGSAPADAPELPGDVALVSVERLVEEIGETAAYGQLVDLLERTYVDTQDCPELCGLREAGDVLESHRGIGRFDPALWWVARIGGRAAGCMLFNVLPEHDSVELVYLGLAPEVRSRGLGGRMLTLGLRHLHGRPLDGAARGRVYVGAGGVTCAVDTRNTPALRLYRRLGFQRMGVRVPVVKRLSSA